MSIGSYSNIRHLCEEQGSSAFSWEKLLNREVSHKKKKHKKTKKRKKDKLPKACKKCIAGKKHKIISACRHCQVCRHKPWWQNIISEGVPMVLGIITECIRNSNRVQDYRQLQSKKQPYKNSLPYNKGVIELSPGEYRVH